MAWEKAFHPQNVEMGSMEKSSSNNSQNYDLAHIETYQTTYDQALTGDLYHDGKLVKQPAPTRDPKDPMNLPTWHKIVAIVCLSFFGALIASAEIILGACLPVFAIEYSPVLGYNPKILATLPAYQIGSNPLGILNNLGGPSIFYVYLLATVPVLVIGVANLFLVPLAISIGRRPVVLITGVIAIAGAVWAGESHSLWSHIGARVLQGIGAGSVESLIPFIIQDITFVHERNTWISGAFGCQGLIIIAIGFSAPFMIVNLSWRWLYHITAIIGSFFLIGTFFFLPETRWQRTRSEMNGVPRDDAGAEYSPRTWRYSLRIWSGTAWKRGGRAMWDTFRTFFYPSILFVTMLNGSVIASAFAAAFTTAPALLTEPWAWPFAHLGLCLVAVLIGAMLVAAITGKTADAIANVIAKRRGKRIPENQLLNLVLPWICSMLGALLFGLSGQHPDQYPWGVFLLSLGFMTFGFLGISTITTVYVLESYPHMAGPALVNVASFRWILAFFLTLYASDWIVDMGYFKTFMIYTGLIAGFGLAIPFVYLYGERMRKAFPGDKGR